jgi:hypothetical protein
MSGDLLLELEAVTRRASVFAMIAILVALGLLYIGTLFGNASTQNQ